MGALRHASIPGAYAWVVTVAPILWAHGDGAYVARCAAALALVFLVAGAVLEPRLGPRLRFGALWAFFVSCAAAWGASPSSLSPAHFDELREIAGMLGWGLFAFAAAAPPLPVRVAPPAQGTPLSPHRRLARGDRVYAAFGILLALAIQLVGLRTTSPERALLVRFVALAAGLATIGAAQEIALARHAVRISRSPRARFRSVFVPLAFLLILLLAGVLAANQG